MNHADLVSRINSEFPGLSVQGRLQLLKQWVNSENLVVSTSAGTFSSAFLHMVTSVLPDIQIVFLDTGYHFTETLRFLEVLEDRLGISVQRLYPDPQMVNELKLSGEPTWETNHDACCRVRKAEPLERFLSTCDGWLSGIRAHQTTARSAATFAVLNQKNQMKIHPILDWNSRQLFDYINANDLPVHPLFLKGFKSIGCEPCTQPALEGNDRSGRWKGKKEECGLHS